MFKNILIAAGVAGLLAALLLTLVQATLITPLILQAETYENAPASAGHDSATIADHAVEHTHETMAAHEEAEHTQAGTDHESHAAAEHHHDADAWKPEDGLQRTLFTLTSNIVMGFGYALLLTGIYSAWRQPTGLAQGLLFGIAGFIVFFAAPGLGLPPELPGTEAAALTARQHWWIATAAATAAGLALLFLQKNWLLRIVAVALLAAPHIIGAPHPAAAGSLAPEQLQHQFRIVTTISNALFWLALGGASALTWKKFAAPFSAPQRAVD